MQLREREGESLTHVADKNALLIYASLLFYRAAAEAAKKSAQDRAMQRALYAAFKDPFDNAGQATANTNPLSKPNRLTALNPLLGSDSD